MDGRLVGTSTTSGMSSASASSIGAETNTYSTVQPLAFMNLSCQTGWQVEDNAGRWFPVTSPNKGVVGPRTPSKVSQTYHGSWDSRTHQLCISKSGL